MLVTDVWLGDPADPPAGVTTDIPRAAALIVATGFVATAVAVSPLDGFDVSSGVLILVVFSGAR